MRGPFTQKEKSQTPAELGPECLDKRFLMDEALKNPSIVCSLEITTDQDLEKLASQSSMFINLQSLSLNKTSISIHSEIWGISSLKTINLHHTTNADLPPEIGNLHNLKVLDIEKADVQSLPGEIGKLVNLSQLIIVYNTKTVTIPPEIGRLSNLKVLTIRRNTGTNLPDSLPDGIEYLDLSDNNITRLQFPFSKLARLKSLNLANNNLTELPQGIDSLSELEYLNIGGNNIKKSEVESLKKHFPNTEIVY